MAIKMKKNLANRSNYGNKRSLKDIEWLVIHYTGNDGDTDENNGKYFHNNVVKASSHYFVDDDSVTQSVPDNYIAYAVGGSKYASCPSTGGGTAYGKCTNANSISIEICDDVKNGKVYPSAKTIENVIELTRYLMKEYDIPVSKVIRHFDVTGKLCPAYWCGTAKKNQKWKDEFWNKLAEPKKEFKNGDYNGKVKTTANLNVRAGRGTDYKILGTLPRGTVVEALYILKKNGSYWASIDYGKNVGYICLDYVEKM